MLFTEDHAPILATKLVGLSRLCNSEVVVKDTIKLSGGFTLGLRPGDYVRVCFPEYSGSLFGLYMMAERLNFSGIGIFPDMTHNGKIVGGLHLDIRQLEPSEQGLRWLGLDDYSKKEKRKIEVYHPATIKNLKKFYILR
jgi:hypothetical protein